MLFEGKSGVLSVTTARHSIKFKIWFTLLSVPPLDRDLHYHRTTRRESRNQYNSNYYGSFSRVSTAAAALFFFCFLSVSRSLVFAVTNERSRLGSRIPLRRARRREWNFLILPSRILFLQEFVNDDEEC